MDKYLLDNRIIIINGVIDDNSSYSVITKLLYLDSISNDDISLYINSPGGSVSQGLAIIDCMNYIKSDVSTFCLGEAYSMASIILASGAKNKRYALPNSEIMIHEPMTKAEGNPIDLDIYSKRLFKTRDILVNILAKSTNNSKDIIIKNLNNDNYMTSKDAKNFGIIDNIIFHHNG